MTFWETHGATIFVLVFLAIFWPVTLLAAPVWVPLLIARL